MKKNTKVLFVIFYLLAIAITQESSDVTQDGVVILSVSQDLGVPNQHVIGSLIGGQKLYMKVLGIDQTPSNNQVFIGPYPCDIADNGVNNLDMVCVTTAPTDLSQINWLPITVQVVGKVISTCTAQGGCNYDYSFNDTPKLYYITPRSNFGSGFTFWRARFIESTTKVTRIQEMKVGGYSCDRFNIRSDGQDDEDINWWDDIIQCQLAKNIEAGTYGVKLRTSNGYASVENAVLQKNVFNDDIYSYKILPQITALSTNVVSPQGQVLKIQGTGFTEDPTKVDVKCGKTQATVLSSTLSEIIVLVPPPQTEEKSSQYISGAGLYYKRFDISDLSKYKDCDTFRNDILLKNDVLMKRVVEQGIYAETGTQNTFGVYYGQFMDGFFKAPKTGQYKFYIASDDCSQLWINMTPGSLATGDMVKVVQCGWSPERNYWYQQTVNPSSTQADAQGKIPITQISKSISLQQDQLYYLQAVHMNGGGPGYLSIAVEIENNDGLKFNSYEEIQSVRTSYNPTKEVLQFKVYNSDGLTLLQDSYTLRFFQKNGQTVVYDKTSRNIAANAKDIDVQNILQWDCGYVTTVVRKNLGNDGNELPDEATSVAGYKYTVTFNQWRQYPMMPTLKSSLTAGTVQYSVVSTQQASPPITGTFSLSFGGQDLTIWDGQKNQNTNLLPYNVDHSTISSAIWQISGILPISWNSGSYNDGVNYFFYMAGGDKSQDLPKLTVTANDLAGGVGRPSVDFSTVQERNENLIFEPIPSELLFTYSNTSPQVTVKINGIQGSCLTGICDYTLDDTRTPIMTQFGRSGATVSITFNDPGQLGLNAHMLDIWHAGQQCTISSFTSGVVNCNLPLSDGQPIVEAGDNVPKVHVEGIGYVKITASNLDSVPLTISSISPAQGSLNGGTTVTINGFGFPSPLKADFVLNIGGQQMKVLSSTNKQIIAITPSHAAGEVTLQMAFNGKSADTKFTYSLANTVIVTMLDKQTFSPIAKGDIVITGSSFGLNKDELSIQLVQTDASIGIAPRVIDINVISVNDAGTLITGFLGGGRTGEYKLIVNREGWGYSLAQPSNVNDFTYQLTVSSVSPSSGSVNGGTLITIQGTNFKPGETQVFFGDAINWLCNIEVVTETTITCITPLKHDDFVENKSIDIHVFGRLTEEAICKGSCSFTYSPTQTPVVAQPQNLQQYLSGARRLLQEGGKLSRHFSIRRNLWGEDTKIKGNNHFKNTFHPQRNLQESTEYVVDKVKVYVTGQKENISGSGFNDQTEIHIGFQTSSNEISAVVSTFSIRTTTQLEFVFPSLAQRLYKIAVYVPGKGYGDFIWFARVALTVTSITPTFGSRGGAKIQILGGGFNQNIVPIVEFYLNTNKIGKCIQLAIIDNEHINCQTPRFYNDQTVEIRITQQNPENMKLETVTNAWYSPSVTQQVNSLSLTKDDSNMYVTTYTESSDQTSFIANGSGLDGTNVQVFLRVQIGTQSYSGTIIAKADNQIACQFTNIPAGVYLIDFLYDNVNFACWGNGNNQLLRVNFFNTAASVVQSSYVGGAKLTITGKGFGLTDQNNHVKVCGINCPIIESTSAFTQVQCQIPPLNTQNTEQSYRFQGQAMMIDSTMYTLTGGSMDQLPNIYDGLTSTTYFENANGCYIQYDFGDSLRLGLKMLRYTPYIYWGADKFFGSKFQYSLDGTTYVDLVVLDSMVHQGWNFYVPEIPIQGIRYIRYIDPNGSTKSQCRIAEIEIKGWLLSVQNPDLSLGVNCDVKVNVNGNQSPVLTNIVQYKLAKTPFVTSVSPLFGTTGGSTLVTITGTGFTATSSDASVVIDDIICVVQSASTTQITCLTGFKDVSNNQIQGQFEVRINEQRTVNQKIFQYGDLYSDVDTWGGDIPPREGDIVYIPKGQVLIIDEDTPILGSLLVEGGLTFADDKELNVNAKYIVVREGKFWIGQEDSPHQNKLTITLYGNLQGIQLPSMGNKVIGCHMCELDIHGVKPSHYYSLLSSTANVGATSIMVDDLTDWKVGDEIVIASSDWDHRQSERRFITSISGRTINFENPLVHLHYSAVETYGEESFPMKIEVALLSRNVVIQGDPTDSMEKQYGAHLMIHGKASMGAIGRIENAEFRYSGQPKILGRYPIHFHLNSEVYDSYVKGNAIHDSNARCITIHGVSYLRVLNNIGYNANGHNIFLEDGIETNNVIQNNLMIGAKQSWIMLQTDITVATYWITNPNNIVTDNRSGGSEWYGFWYEIKEHPDGPSATSDICPPGLKLGRFNNNVAHSNGRFGLRILEMAPREQPCKDAWNQALADPFSDNLSYEAIFENFITWKNNEDGVIGEILGDITFRNFKIADSKYSGFQAHKTNLTSRGAIIDNFLIVGKSIGNPQVDDYYIGSHGIVVPRTDGFLAQNIRFWNFDANMILLQSCSVCWNMKLWVQGGKNTKFENLKFFNSNDAQMIYWEKHRREIFWDLDGSITGPTLGTTGKAAYIVPYKAHLDGVPGCQTMPDAKWDNSIICVASPNLQVRDILINNPVPKDNFQGVDQKIFRLDQGENELIDLSEESEKSFQQETMMIIKKSKDVPFSFASPFVTNQIYNIHWKEGIDFAHLGIFPSQYFKPDDKGIVLRFNYSSYRETFDIQKNIGGQLTTQYIDIGVQPDPASCVHGTFFNNLENKFLYLCLSGKGSKDRFEYVDVNSVICRETCDTIGTTPVEDVFTPWSSPDAWDSGVLPKDGEDAILKAGKKVRFDVDQSVALNELLVLGELHFDNSRPSSLLQAHNIFVRSGKIFAGSETTKFTSKLDIVLSGTFGDDSLVIDPFVDASSKVLAVTGGIELYGNPPQTIWTRLSSYAKAGDSSIQVSESNGWAVGDEIVLGPSGRDPEQHEKHTIQFIEGKVISLEDPLQFDHYGAEDITIDKGDIGKLDMRAGVGHLTRNIRIRGTHDQHNWGCRVLIYQFVEPGESIPRRGYGRFNGVEWENCGQYDTSNAALDLIGLNSQTIRKPSFVTNSAFHDSSGMFIHAYDIYDFTVQNNVLYKGVKALMQLNLGRNIVIENNLMIYLQQRKSEDGGLANWAVFIDFADDEVEDPSTITSDNISVQNNVGQGSQDTGFFFMATQCSQMNKVAFSNNECSSTTLACFVYRQIDDGCNIISGVKAFHAHRGLMATFNGPTTKVTNVIMAENDISVVYKPGLHNQYDNSLYASNMYITAIARPSCVECYQLSTAPLCKNQIGFQLGSISSVSFPPHATKPSDKADTICTTQMIDGRVYMNSVEFENFKLAYDNLDQCDSNSIFRQHRGAVDMNCAHLLTNTKCTNCNPEAYFSFRDADPSLIGWFGGCGSFECTGQINALIQDQDGQFFGEKAQAIPNNKYFAPNATDICTFVTQWNGYKCSGNGISELKWMSIAPDYNKRLFSPVSLTDGQWFNYVNSLKEWAWDGPEPLNLRESKFTALIKVNSVINMGNAGMNPSDAHFWLLKRSPVENGGSPDDWVIIKLQYFEPLSIIVSNDYNSLNRVIKPFIQTQKEHADLNQQTHVCGANNYFREINTIHFVVTGAVDCLVRVKQSNSVFITSRLSVNYDTYWSDGTKNSGDWLAMTVALMGEDTNNIKIVGHRPTGSKRQLGEARELQEADGMEISWEVSDPQPIGGDGYDPAAVTVFLQQKTQDAEEAAASPKWKQELKYDNIYNGATLAVVEDPNYKTTEVTIASKPKSAESSLIVQKSQDEVEPAKSANNNALVIGLTVGLILGFLVIGGIIATVILIRRKNSQIQKNAQTLPANVSLDLDKSKSIIQPQLNK